MKFLKSKKNRYLIQFILFVLIAIAFFILAIPRLETPQLLLMVILFGAGSYIAWKKYQSQKQKENHEALHEKQDKTQTQNHIAQTAQSTPASTPTQTQTGTQQATKKVMFGGLNLQTKVVLGLVVATLGILGYMAVTSFGLFGMGSPVGKWYYYPGSDSPGGGMSYVFDVQMIEIRADGTWTCYSTSYDDNHTWIDDQGTWTKDGSDVILHGHFGPMRYRRSFNSLIDVMGTKYVKK